MAKELKQMKVELKTLKNKVDIKSYSELKQEIKSANDIIERLSNENNLLKQGLEKEQRLRSIKNEKIVMLEEVLQRTEREMKQCEEARYKLSVDVQTLQTNIQKLSDKLTESEREYRMNLNFVGKIDEMIIIHRNETV